MTKRRDLTGRTFGYLTVLNYSHNDPKSRSPMWLCRCVCGKEKVIAGFALTSGNDKSCGCRRHIKRKQALAQYIKQDAVNGTRISALRAKLHKGNKSGHKGVKWLENRQRWLAYIGYKGKQINLGYYKNKEEAIAARLQAEEKYHKPHLEDNMIRLTGEWDGWIMDGKVLISPTGRKFTPQDIEPEFYSQAELARALGVTPGAIQDRIRRGTLPPFDKDKTWHRDSIAKHLK